MGSAFLHRENDGCVGLRVAFSKQVDNSDVMKSPPRMDGRVARGERNTEAIVKALQRLYARGRYSPTVGEVAALAGVTRRSIYNRFPDIESVAEELAARQLQDHDALYKQVPEPELPLQQRITEFVSQCAELFEVTGPVRRAALVNAHRSQALRRHVRRMQSRAADRVSRAFERELAGVQARERKRVLQGLILGCSFDAWDRLRTVQKLPIQEAQEVLECWLSAMLERVVRRSRHTVVRSGEVRSGRVANSS